MAKFQYEQTEQQDDRVHVTVDGRYSLTIIRSDEGLIIDVWPIQNGEFWDHPYDSFQVFDNDVVSLEQADD